MFRWSMLFLLIGTIMAIVKSGSLGAGGLPVMEVVFWVVVAAASILLLYLVLGFDKRLAQ